MLSSWQLRRQRRVTAGLTGEGPDRAASLSTRSAGDLERGINRTARNDTARLLADALHLAGQDRVAFVTAARGRALAGGLAADAQTLPRDTSAFTGRATELRQLTCAAGEGGIWTIGGMPGAGKTTFAVHAARQLAPRFPGGQIFLPLHGHTAGQHPVRPADALASLLQATGAGPRQIPADPEARAGAWRDRVAGKRLLLLLDDAVSSDQVRPLLPATPGSLVLVTSRHHLTALDDARAISLATLPPARAAQLLTRLAGRPGLQPADPAVIRITRLCDCLPLAVGMLARQLSYHPSWSAADVAADLAAAVDRLELLHAGNLSVAAAFEGSYHDLPAAAQLMFCRLGLQPGTDVDAYAAAALAGVTLPAARRALETLCDRCLLTEPARGRYRFHDLIRQYARALAAAAPPAERHTATGRLLDYYLHTARAASRHLSHHAAATTPGPAAGSPGPARQLTGPQDAIAWLAAERLNLDAAARYAAISGRAGHAAAIPAALHQFLRSHGHWDQALALHQAAIQAARDADNQLAEASAATDLAELQFLTGHYTQAIRTLTRALELYRGLGDRLGEAGVLTTLGGIQQATGNQQEAAVTLTRALELYRGLGDRLGEATAMTTLGTGSPPREPLPGQLADRLARP